MANVKRTPIVEAQEESMDATACIMAMEKHLAKAFNELQRAKMHSKGCSGQLEEARSLTLIEVAS